MTAGGKGLATCPSGDSNVYSYITVTALRADLTPIQGIPSNSFFFTVTGSGSGNVSIEPYDAETDVNGSIRFEARGDGSVPYGSLTIGVQIYTVVVLGTGTLWCNTYDYDLDGFVTPLDFSAFAADFGGSNERSDFNWDSNVDPLDFGLFAAHFGH
jgi:hypothetical protein